MIHNNLNRVGNWLARRDLSRLDVQTLGSPVDCIVLVGSSLISAVRVAAKAWRDGVAPQILVSGGIGHSTEDLRQHIRANPQWSKITTEGRSESEMMRDILVRVLDIPASAVLMETRSRNCGENAEESRRTLDELGGVDSLVIIQDPTMQRRTHATFERAWRNSPAKRLISYAPFIPELGPDLQWTIHADPLWSLSRYVSLVVGEMDRLRDDSEGYGPNGRNFIDHVDIPEDVLTACQQIRNEFHEANRPAAPRSAVFRT